MPTTLNQETNKAVTQPLVELFELDTTTVDPVNGQVYHFTPMTDYVGPNDGRPEGYVSYGGITYQPFPIQASGWLNTFDGAPAKPKLAVSNVSRFLQATVNSMGDLVGAKVTRTRTYMNFLDGHEDADSQQHFPVDIFYIDQKTSHTKNQIEWALISSVERSGVMLPLRQMLPGNGEGNFQGISKVRLR